MKINDGIIRDKIFCSNCSLKCIASDCECVCHTQPNAFNYGIKEGKKELLEKVFNKIARGDIGLTIYVQQEIDKRKDNSPEVKNQNTPVLSDEINVKADNKTKDNCGSSKDMFCSKNNSKRNPVKLCKKCDKRLTRNLRLYCGCGYSFCSVKCSNKFHSKKRRK